MSVGAILVRARGLLIVVTPVVAIATLALGLRIGAADGVRAAVVYGSPLAEGATHASLQVHTLFEETGVRDVAVVKALAVTARSGGREVQWRGATNSEGVAEVPIDLRVLRDEHAAADAAPAPVTLEVRDETTHEVLALGAVPLDLAPPAPTSPPPLNDAAAARPTRKQGALAVDVFVLGQKLVAGSPSAVFVRVSDPTTRDFVRGEIVVEAESDQGATVTTPRVTACANGWAEVGVTAIGHLAALTFRARAADGRTGEWYGPLNVALGPAVVALPLRIASSRPFEARAVAPPVRKVTYVEVDDAHGRAYAAAVDLTRDDYGSASAPLTLPPLAPGRYWLVTAHDARGAETFAPGTLVRPFDVGAFTSVDRCIDGPALARATVAPIPRTVALDGFGEKHGKIAAKRARGRAIAIGALVVAGLLEALLLVGGALRAQSNLASAMGEMERIEHEAPRTGSASATSSDDGLDDPFFEAKNIATPAFSSVAVGVLLALLGFALLAAMVSYQAT